MGRKSVWSFVWRGALGGIIGSVILLLLSVLNYRLTLGYIPYSYLFIVGGLVVILPVGIMIGGLIGVVVWLIEFKTERKLGVTKRLVMGAIIALITGVIMSVLSAKNEGVTKTTLTNLVVWIFTLGILPGLMTCLLRNNQDNAQ